MVLVLVLTKVRLDVPAAPSRWQSRRPSRRASACSWPSSRSGTRGVVHDPAPRRRVPSRVGVGRLRSTSWPTWCSSSVCSSPRILYGAQGQGRAPHLDSRRHGARVHHRGHREARLRRGFGNVRDGRSTCRPSTARTCIRAPTSGCWVRSIFGGFADLGVAVRQCCCWSSRCFVVDFFDTMGTMTAVGEEAA